MSKFVVLVSELMVVDNAYLVGLPKDVGIVEWEWLWRKGQMRVWHVCVK